MKSHYYLQGSFLALISMLMLSAAAVYGSEESIVLTTYYPSPYGVYGEMRLYPKASATCNSQQEGLMYYDNNAGKHVLRVCGGSPLGWQDLGGGFWAASPFNSNNIYNTNSGSVGIGRSNPVTKLDIDFGNEIAVAGSNGIALRGNNNPGIIAASGIQQLFTIGGVTSAGSYTNNSQFGDATFTTSIGRILFGTGTSPNNNPRLTIANSGNVGVGTTNPQAKLHIIGSDDHDGIMVRGGIGVSRLGDTKVSAGLGADSGGVLELGAIGPSVDPRWFSVNPVSGGTPYIDLHYGNGLAEDYNTRIINIANNALAFYTRSGGEVIRISGSNVGIGTANPVVKLHVMGNMGSQWPGEGPYGDYFLVNQESGRPVVRITDGGSYYPVLQFGRGDSWMNLEYTGSALQIGGNTGSTVLISGIAVGGAYPGYTASYPYETIGMNPVTNLRINFGSVQKYVFYNNGVAEAAAGGAWNVASDKRFKENVAELTDVMRALKNIRGVRFDWKTKDFPQKGFPEGRQIGFIAQEVEQEFPELVATNPEGYKSLDYGKLTPVLLQAIKEQQAEIESLKARIDKLEEKRAGLKTPG